MRSGFGTGCAVVQITTVTLAEVTVAQMEVTVVVTDTVQLNKDRASVVVQAGGGLHGVDFGCAGYSAGRKA